ncbi:SDR family NAD(P)-dependent oxidoreductase [Methylobacterium gnaphalii]|uniref:Short-chain dehydrogenase n=1 Tax=Methylobacterium gnaphalii TaxID=1010610 RepID=A0A512JRU4_9HYPH|nr:SDR family NAD(P)-dependent oxidoreductase [Methylobacterium gnaphalii]GEP12675.1 short-chain dehydrogenase [Methylobacterium gnaphalii]GJD70859.1 putative oxidoreductase [Methylobacterium gnaphalii]GLS51698.1 short-chain dehydrogenase [Methylobacterium gnaphalii]
MPVILITGASSGIGAALARLYAAPGTTLILNARGIERLEAVAQTCRARGADVLVEAFDVCDRVLAGARLRALDAARPLDLVIVNAGINGGHPDGAVETEEVAFATMDTNLGGALNVALPCVTLMDARGAGQIALVSSLAAYAPLPDAPSYSGSKAALLAHGLALRQKLGPRGVRVNVVTPGYVRTAMGATYKKGWRPLEIDADRAASLIARGLERNRDVIAFPWILTALARGAGLVPEWVVRLGMAPFKARIGDAR